MVWRSRAMLRRIALYCDFDVVVEYGILHHIPHWRGALAESARVLKPGGVFYFKDLLKGFVNAPGMVQLFDHPHATQFTGAEFL